MFADIVPEQLRSTVYAFDRSFEGAVAACAAPLVGKRHSRSPCLTLGLHAGRLTQLLRDKTAKRQSTHQPLPSATLPQTFPAACQ